MASSTRMYNQIDKHPDGVCRTAVSAVFTRNNISDSECRTTNACAFTLMCVYHRHDLSPNSEGAVKIKQCSQTRGSRYGLPQFANSLNYSCSTPDRKHALLIFRYENSMIIIYFTILFGFRKTR